MADTNSSSPLPTTDNDSDSFTHLRQMYKRYMLNPTVARWLLSRDAPTDIHAVRREKSVMVSISSTASPKVIPQHTPKTPFPTSSDLMFLDHVQDGFAFGHIWGNLQPDTHPFAPLAARACKSGWDHVQCRKFASDLAVDGTLEVVEYSWFTNNRAIVILSRIPYKPGTRIVRTSEILFFDPVERADFPPQRPELVLLVHDRSMCTGCGNAICRCPNAIGIDRAMSSSCRITRGSTGPEDKSVAIERVVQSWEDRARVVSHGSKRGLLSIVYSGSFAGSFSQITVRQAYVSVCEDQDAIGYRIQQHLTKLLSRMPPIPSSVIGQPTPGIAALPAFNSTQGCGISLTQEISSQSPMGFTPKEGGWFGSTRQSIFPSVQDKPIINDDGHKRDCCSSATQAPKLGTSCGPVQGALCSQKVGPDAAAECTTSCKSLKEAHSSDKDSASGAREILSGSAAPQDVRGEEQEIVFRGSLCGPEKTRKECDCSAEKMQDPALARILNSRRDHTVSNGVEDMASFMEPIFANSLPGSSSLLQPVPSMNPTALIANMPRQDHRRVEQFPSGPTPSNNPSSDSTRCGKSTTLPSPLPQPPVLQVEPARKRPKTDALLKPEPFGFGLEAGWQNSLEDRDKMLPLPACNGRGGNIERPLSALSRALGVARSPSPFALMSTLPKTPSPPAPAAGAQAFAYGKTGPPEFDFQSPFDSMPIPSLVEFSKKPADRMNVGPRPQVGNLPGIQHKSPGGRARKTGAATENVAGNGVCCDICGISFAKRSNKLRHIQTVHNRLRQFECDLCGTKFGLKADLGRHRFRIHESRAFRCDTCGKSFAEQVQLEHHIRVTHEEDSRPWECKTCRIRFGRKSSLTRHEQTVHQQTRFECRFCKKSYSQKFDAVRHERRVHGIHDKAGSAGIKQRTG